MDTTSLYFEGLGGQSIGQYGNSKDHRPDLRQMILAVLIDGDGRAVCSEMWPANTADVTSLVPVIERGRDTGYSAKAVTLGGARYIVCINHQEAAKDAADRTAILTALERQLHRGDKAWVGNTGYRRFLKTVGDGHSAIDRGKADDARFDGVFVLRTNTELNPLAAMLRYKQLSTVEQNFRTAKHLLATRPIYHQRDETIRGHVFCSFLALVLKAELEARIAALGHKGCWPAIIDDLDALTETEVEQDARRFMLRSTPKAAAGLALRAAGVALPPTVQAIAAD
jgi:transposase